MSYIWGMKKIFKDFINECWGFTFFIYMIGVHYHSKAYFILMLMNIYECNFICIHIVTCIFIIEIVCVLLDFLFQNTWVFLEYVMNLCGSWFLMKGAPSPPPRHANN